MIAYICLCEAVSSFNAMIKSVNSFDFIKYTDIDKLFQLTVLFTNNPDAQNVSKIKW